MLNKKFIWVLVAIFVYVGCAENTETENAYEGEHVLVDAEGFTPIDDTVVSLEFTDRQLKVSAGCNHLTWDYEVSSGTLVTSDFMMTMMYCGGELDAQDAWLADFFESAPTVEFSGDQLVFTTEDATLFFMDRQMAEPDLTVAGYDWQIETLIDDSMAGAILIEGENPVIRFEEDGSVNFESACNTGSGSYTATGDTLSFSNMSFTASICEDFETNRILSEVTAFFENGNAGYEMDSDRLSVFRNDQELVASADAY